jgi:hypothetical protein
MFSLPFFQFLIFTGLIWTLLAAVTLIALLVIDWKNGNLW